MSTTSRGLRCLGVRGRSAGRLHATDAQRLAEAGVPVRHLRYPMFRNIALPEASDRTFAEMIEVLHPLV